MQVIVTIVLILALASWTIAVYSRLVRLRDQIKLAWKKLEVDRSNDAIRSVYDRHVKKYNDVLDGFPANLIAIAAGFKPAKPFRPNP